MKSSVRSIILLLVISVLVAGCAGLRAGKESVRASRAAEAIQPMRPQKPDYPFDPELERKKRLFKKAYEQLSREVIGKEEILKKREFFPRISIEVLEETPIEVFLDGLSRKSGWRIENRSSRSLSLKPPIRYDFVPLSDVIYDLAGMLGVEAVANFKLQTIYFTDLLTKTFYIPVLEGRESISFRNTPSNLGQIGGSVGASQGGSSESEAESGRFEFSLSGRQVLQQLRQAIESYRGVRSVIVNPVTSEITVTASVEAMGLVEKTIKKTIDEMAKQIEVRLTIFEVTFSEESNRNKFFNYIREAARDTTQITIGQGAPSRSVLSFSFSHSDPDKVVSFLLATASNFGHGRVVANSRVLTQNNFPTTLFNGRVIEYIESMTVTFQQEREIITTTTGQVSDGLSIHILPKVLDDDKILLTLVPRLSSATFREINLRTQRMELPTVSVRQQYVRFITQDGSTLLFGAVHYGSTNNSTDEAGLPFLFSIPVSKSVRAQRTDLFFVIHARIVDMKGNYLNGGL